jgi:D-alanyl-D-alanine carboxypeptidase
MVTIVIHSKSDHETEDIRIGLNIEIALNIVNQSTHHIAQDIIKLNRDIIRVPKIENISNNKTFKFNYSQSNQI